MSELTDFEHYLRVTKKLADRSVSTYLFRVNLFLREYGNFTDEALIEWKENQIDNLKSANYINQGLISFKIYKQFKKLDVQIPKSVPSQKKQFIENVISRADYDYLCRYMIDHFHKTKDKK